MTVAVRISLKKYPYVRLLLALAAGIIIEWYVQPAIITLVAPALAAAAGLAGFAYLSITKKFYLRWLQGCCILLLFSVGGAALTYLRDIRNHRNWFGNYQQASNAYRVTLQELPEQKTRSFKAIAYVDAVKVNDQWLETSGKILLYFPKENFHKGITYGSQIIFRKPLQNITNTGNPGAFDYNRYCLFQGITAQVYLKNDEFSTLAALKTNWFNNLLIKTRNNTLEVLKTNIKGARELGVAEALLIGYRTDLDKDLVQAYSNTGVVHIIAISGLHLGMIYGLLAGLFSLFKRFRYIKIIRPIIILFVLWMFTLVAGAAPSILRSAIMFSFIAFGELINRKTNIYNTLAASAFCMLVADPFTLWDAGFLLSYSAVISIVTFMKPVYNWLYFENKIVDKIWSLTSVTIAAQVLTIPIVIFYFHQFPNLFLVTNLFAVPLSGLILYGEILLLIIAPISSLAYWLGNLLNMLIAGMNHLIEGINVLPFAVWNNLQISIAQTWLMYAFTIAACIWFMQQSKAARNIAFAFLTCFIALISIDLLSKNTQRQLIVYNVPKMSAVDILQGRHFLFTGDSSLNNNEALRNFYLTPSRIFRRAEEYATVTGTIPANEIVTIHNKKLLLINNNFTVPRFYTGEKIALDLVIVTKNPQLTISQLNNFLDYGQIVFDSSNPLWKIQLWKKDCDSLHLRFHSTADNGAYVMEL